VEFAVFLDYIVANRS